MANQSQRPGRRLRDSTARAAGAFLTRSLWNFPISAVLRYAAAVWLGTAGWAVGFAAEPPDPTADGRLPQYIFFNRAPHQAGEASWDHLIPARFTPQSCRDVVDGIGTPGNDRLRIGVSFVFSILEGDLPTIAQSLSNLLAAAQASDVPVLITLDGQNWWQRRPDLWNWWDPGLPGFNPENRLNVEWTGWGPEHAVKIGWRNWGTQHRVRPAPNLASPRFLAEHWKAYDILIPIILRWQEQLPAKQKYLFGGVKLGWEASINVNAYYHDDGNRLFEESPVDTSKDPTRHDPRQGWTFGHKQPLGYAAVATSGIRKSGTLTREDIEQVVHEYLAKLCREAVRRGLPRDMLFTHQGGTFAPWDKHMDFRPAINDDSIPGWSFYEHDPQDSGSLAADLERAGRRQWAASEWWRGAADRAGWKRNFERALRFNRCRFVCVYNWESFAKFPEAHAAVRELAKAATSRPEARSPRSAAEAGVTAANRVSRRPP